MRRPILAIVGFGAVAALIANAALGWASWPTGANTPAVRFAISLSVTL